MDVIIENPQKAATIVKERLINIGVKNVKIIRHPAMEDVLTEHYEIKIGQTTVLILFQPIACYNYNVLTLGKHKVKVATIDTMLSFYLVFAYANQQYFDVERILCMAQMLFDIEEENRTNQKGLLKRFSIDCYGEQDTLATIRAEKSDKFKELKDKGVERDSKEWNEWFFKYSPAEEAEEKTPRSNRSARKPYKPRRNRTQRKRLPLSFRSFFKNRRSNRNTLL
jgi:hypothetical protein